MRSGWWTALTLLAVAVLLAVAAAPAAADVRAEAAALGEAAVVAEVERRREARGVRRSDERFSRDFERCRITDRVADFDGATVIAVYQYAIFDAFTRPLRGEMARFVERLRELRATDPVLAAGAAAWVRALDYRPLYHPRPSFCAVLTRWRASRYSDALRPPAYATLNPIWRAARTDTRAIRMAVRRLVELGVERRAALAFERAFPRPLELRYRPS